MFTIELPKKLFVETRDCGSTFNTNTGKIKDKNTCYWNCLYFYLTNILEYKNIDIFELKHDTTINLPFNKILIGKNDPSIKGNLADHRVIQRTIEIFSINICLLTSGTHIYNFETNSNDTMCLFLHNNHYTLVEDIIYIKRMLFLLINKELVLNFQPLSNSKKRRKRGKNKIINNSYKNILLNKHKKEENLFNTNLIEIPKPQILFEKPKRKRGKRYKKN